ncbi:hypothetical protein [Ruegeria sp. 6PALISEP08]|uniref:hypothetical protein n=1 Tax=Ruegeria sp. 6PALISEP08 TaxID=1225660 RepID=UPI000AC18993|nr:hypothetical protein [Ruegeria sp. 6PALISEP08]
MLDPGRGPECDAIVVTVLEGILDQDRVNNLLCVGIRHLDDDPQTCFDNKPIVDEIG